MLLIFALSAWTLITLFVLSSRFKAPFLRHMKDSKPRSTPLISILVPAKDEEANIEMCLKSLTAQDYPNFEIIVIDDRSTDRTGEICRKFAAIDKRIKILQISELPAGWTGKNHAIHEGVKHAKGAYLLFIDADTSHDPCCVSAAMALSEKEGLDALSVEPYFAWSNFFQELTFSIFTLVTACIFPIFLVNKRGSKTTLSNGQFILIKRKVYDSIGGHKAIAGRILEDLALAENVKKKGYHYNLAVGTGLITVKMYKDMASFWQGWSRILFLALKGNMSFALMLYLISIVISLFPFMIVIYIAITAAMGLPPINLISILGLITVGLIIFANSFINSFFRISPFYSLLHPIAVISGMAVMGNSIMMATRKRQLEWKGTTYRISSYKTDSRP